MPEFRHLSPRSDRGMTTGSPCSVELVQQESFAPCRSGINYGCSHNNPRQVWTHACRGIFRCAGSQEFQCGYPPGKPRYNCSCDAAPSASSRLRRQRDFDLVDRAPRRSSTRRAGRHDRLVAALGVMVGLRTPEPAWFRFAGPPAPELRWRWIITDAFEGPRTARHLVAPCANEGAAAYDTGQVLLWRQTDYNKRKQAPCACKTAWWFANALQLFPSAEFIGKLEEDTVIHAARLVLELREASRVSRLSWYGLFQWAAANDQDRPPDKVAYCGESTNAWLGGGPAGGCRRDWPAAFAHPFASGGLDVRSRTLVNETRSCMQLDQGMFEQMFGEHNSCDNFLGYLLWKCTARAFLFDLTFRKWAHPHVQFTEARRAHTTVIHPAKDTARHQWDVPGPALAPVAMIARRVITGRRVHVKWRPLNATAVQRFQEVFDVAKHPEPCREAPEVCYSATGA